MSLRDKRIGISYENECSTLVQVWINGETLERACKNHPPLVATKPSHPDLQISSSQVY